MRGSYFREAGLFEVVSEVIQLSFVSADSQFIQSCQ